MKYAESEAKSENKNVWDYMALCCNQGDWLSSDSHSTQQQNALRANYLNTIKQNPYTSESYQKFVNSMQSSSGADQYIDDPYQAQRQTFAKMKIDESDTDDESLNAKHNPESESESESEAESEAESNKESEAESDEESDSDEESEAKEPLGASRQAALKHLRAQIKHLQSQQSYADGHKSVMRAKQLVTLFIQ